MTTIHWLTLIAVGVCMLVLLLDLHKARAQYQQARRLQEHTRRTEDMLQRMNELCEDGWAKHAGYARNKWEADQALRDKFDSESA